MLDIESMEHLIVALKVMVEMMKLDGKKRPTAEELIVHLEDYVEYKKGNSQCTLADKLIMNTCNQLNEEKI